MSGELYGFSPVQLEGISKTIQNRGDIAIGVIGQSNEQDQVLAADLALFPQAFNSLFMPFAMPQRGRLSLTNSGGFWYKVFDKLLAKNYKAKIFNGAIGSSSFVAHVCGTAQARANSTGYSARRAPVDAEDRGYFGDITVQSGKVFVCTTGRAKFAFRRKDTVSATAWNVPAYDYIQTNGAQATAAADPGGWAAAAVGDTIVDGTIIWTCVEAANSTGISNGTLLTTAFGPYGFDPFGILERVHANMQQINASQKIIYIANAQSDTSQTQAIYQAALENIASFFLARGYKVCIGLSCYTPTTTTANYDKLTAAQQAAIVSQKAGAFGSRCFAGANLYTSLGSTGNMATGGAYLQGDNVHLNAAGALDGADYIGDSILYALAN